jgi:hypothetical protein
MLGEPGFVLLGEGVKWHGVTAVFRANGRAPEYIDHLLFVLKKDPARI